MCNLDKGYYTEVHFLVEWLNNCYSSNNELQVFISITSLNQCTMAAPVLSHFELTPEASGNLKVKCKHSASYISGLKGAGQHLCENLLMQVKFLKVRRNYRHQMQHSVPVTIGLRHQMNQISSTFNNKMVSTFKRSIKEGLSRYEKEESYAVAAVLHLRFKLRWCESDKIDYVESVVRKNLQTVSVQDDEILNSPPKKKPRSEDFFVFMSPVSKYQRKRNISGAVNELETYLQESCQEMDTNPLDYWKINYINYPTLAKLANKLLSPATSAPVERLFSIAGIAFRPKSCSLKDDTFEKLNMMIKCIIIKVNLSDNYLNIAD